MFVIDSCSGMPKPAECSEAIYAMILKCWKTEPEQRPSFGDLFDYFSQLVQSKLQREGSVLQLRNKIEESNVLIYN